MTSPRRALIAPLSRLAVAVAALGLLLLLMWSVSVPAWAEVPRLALYLGLAVLVMHRWAVGEMGYAPVAAAALGDVDLVHFSRLTTAELDPTRAGVVDLSPEYCTFRARMLRRDLFWPRRTVPAVYFFAGEPPSTARAGQVTSPRARVAIDIARVRGPVFQRPDGCIALPGGYQGPARISDLVDRAD